MKQIVRSAALFLILAAALAAPGLPAEADESDQTDPGQQAFEAAKCNLCHSVEIAGIEAKTKSEKMKGPDLSADCEELDVDWTFQYIKREVLKDDKKHKKEFKGTDEELQTIVDWLAGLKAPE